MTLREWMEQHGRSTEQTAETLTALLGREISANAVKLQMKRFPPAWAEALGVDPFVAGPSPAPPRAAPIPSPPPADPPPGDEKRGEQLPPRPPPGADVAPPPPSPAVYHEFAKGRIVQLYGMVGAGVALGLANDGVTRCFDAQAPALADAWLAAAEQNEFARRFVAFVTTGGPLGELVLGHAILLGGILYVKGILPDIGLYDGLRPYREPAPAPYAGANGDEPAQPAQPGAAAAGPADTVADAPGAARG